jgi:hypothetical protein
MSDTLKSRFGGLFLCTLSIILTLWMWHTALTTGIVYMKASFLGPAMLPSGIYLLVTGQTQNVNHNPVVKGVLVASGLALGGINLYLLMA